MIQIVEGGYIANINKPRNWTSFDVVKKIRKLTQIKKVGHAGTLDPFATGVLLILLGKATKQMNQFLQLPKKYCASLQLGFRTDTLDVTGKIVEEKPVPSLDEFNVRNVLETFRGKIRQRIPEFSAAKTNGQRFYDLARQGKKIPLRFKTVEIFDIDLLNFDSNIAEFEVLCSSGTYIRVLGSDIAEKLGTVGYLKDLTRTAIGEYNIDDAIEINEFQQKWEEIKNYANIP